MSKSADRSRGREVREPVQVYLVSDDSDLLNRLSQELGVSKAEVLRLGVRSLARERSAVSPMMRFLDEMAAADWPAEAAGNVDDLLIESYLDNHENA